MAKRKKRRVAKKSPAKESASKESFQGFPGGINVDLNRKMESGRTLGDELAEHLAITLDKEIDNRAERLENLDKWQKQYSGWREPKSFPFEKSANTSTPMTRAAVDTVYVRMEDTLYGRERIVLIKPVDPDATDIAFQIEDGLEWYLRNIMDFKRKMISPLMQSVKTGAGYLKVGWVEEKRVVYRYAKQEELDDPDITTYPSGGEGDDVVKIVRTLYRGPQIFPIQAEDWISTADAPTLDEAYITGFKFYLRKPQVTLRVRQDLYYKEAADKLTNPDEIDQVKKTRAQMRGKEIEKTEYEEPYELYELWLSYDVDEDGEEDSIMVIFHRESKQLLRAIYNPIFSQFRPFEALVFYPLEYSQEGEGICEILYKLQIEVDTLHNQRIDRMTEINAPLVFVRAGIGLDNYKINPGEVTPVDEDLDSAIRIENFPDVYYSTMQEEDRINEYGRQAVGIAPEMQGQTAAERPVFKEAFARLQEANKKFQSGRDNIIRGYERTIKKVLEFFAQYEPTYEYTAKEVDEEGNTFFANKSVEFPLEIIWDGIRVELAAATETMNPDMRREINMTVYHLLSDYMTKSAGMVEAILSVDVQSEFKQWLIAQYEVGVTLIRRIMEDFDQADAQSLALALDQVIDVNAAIETSIDLLPPEQQAAAEEQAQGGGNGQEGTEQAPAEGAPTGSAPAAPAQ